MTQNTRIEIHNIPVDKIFPHPQNPRRNLGDISELTDSIRENGIFQNLTVVPKDDDTYTVIIGHRRLAAAKEAGLTEVPCVIADLDEKAQIAAMLVENVNRSDLTVYEQAQGFQMMLDLGEDVESVSKMTGFSQSTIRRRTKLLQLDSDAFKATEGRDITLQDYEKLFDINNPERRNEVLKQLGTDNFHNAYYKALEEDREEKQVADMIETVNELTSPLPDDANEDDFKYIGWANDAQMVKDKCTGNCKYYFKMMESNKKCVKLYREYTESESSASSSNTAATASTGESSEERAERAAAEAELKRRRTEIVKRMFTLRKNFVRDASLKGKALLIKEYAARILLANDMTYLNAELICEVLNIPSERKTKLTWDDILPKFAVDPERVLFALIYAQLGDNDTWSYFKNCPYHTNKLNSIYDMLTRFGYAMSDEEKALMNGTHELCEKKETTNG